MAIEITVPRLGWNMDEGVFVAWHKNEGDLVQAGEPLFSLETDKAVQEVESLDSGRLRIVPGAPNPGETVRVGTVIGSLHPADGFEPGTETGLSAAPVPRSSPRAGARPVSWESTGVLFLGVVGADGSANAMCWRPQPSQGPAQGLLPIRFATASLR